MEKYKQEFIEFMVDCGVLKFGDFVTKSGRKTPFFVNTGFYRTGAQLRKLGEYYAKAIQNTFGTEFDVLFGPAYKGIPLTVAASMALSEHFDADIKYCSNRKEVKDHGDKGILLGSPIAYSGRSHSRGSGNGQLREPLHNGRDRGRDRSVHEKVRSGRYQ